MAPGENEFDTPELELDFMENKEMEGLWLLPQGRNTMFSGRCSEDTVPMGRRDKAITIQKQNPPW